MKRRLATFLSNNWWKLLLAVLLIVGVWVLIMQSLNKIQPQEKLSITFVGADFNDIGCEDDLQKFIPDVTEQKLRSITVSSIVDPTGYTSATLLTVRTLGDTDFLIYEEKFAKGAPSVYEPLTQQVIDAFPEYEQYIEKEKAYGFYIPDNSKLYSYYTGSERLVVFISAYCENMAALNGKGKQEYDCAYIALKYLMEE